MTDGVVNEFRFLDEQMTIPLSVAVVSGQVFVVSFKFFNDNSGNIFAPSVIYDSDGCQAGKNTVFAIPGGWLSACDLGVTGDWFIRAVVDCNPTQACCFKPSGCLNLTTDDCGVAGGVSQGAGSDCASTVCNPMGACCYADESCDDDMDPTDCANAGGTYQGDDTQCASVTCPAPTGACCLSNDNCLVLNEADCDVIPGSSWAGALTACPDDCQTVCVTVEDCCDTDTDGVRDDGCTWCACDAPQSCTLTPTPFADMGGAFSACPPDGFCNIHDANHALACFSGTSSCDGLNLDAGGAFGACPPDGFCNIHDANHALSCFSGLNTCTCPGAASPEMGPVTVGAASLVVAPAEPVIVPGGSLPVRVFLAGPVEALQSYQLHLEVSGGRRGGLELVDVYVEDRDDFVFRGAGGAFEAVNLDRQQMLSGLVDGDVGPVERAYLATYLYRATGDAAGEFVIDVRHDEASGDQTYLVSSYVNRIAVRGVKPGKVRVAAAPRTGRR